VSCRPIEADKPIHPALQALPPTIVWAWERREDLRWLPGGVGVAYVASAVDLAGPRIRIAPRAKPLLVNADTRVIPVVHVDASWREPPELNTAQRQALVDQVLIVARRAAVQNGVRVVQLDFEARLSQREFLADVVRDIRAQLAPTTALSITALASWCMGDYWLSNVQADELVPMAFRMGRDSERLRRQLAQQGFVHSRCQDAVGLATDEPLAGKAATQAKRRYYFSPTSWTPETWSRLAASGTVTRP
jgi:hypothetical protein